MESLCDVHIEDLKFLKEGTINVIILSKYQISIRFDSGAQITIYSRLIYRENEKKEGITFEAESEKIYCPYTRILNEKINSYHFLKNNSLELAISNESSVELPAFNNGFESFVIHSPENEIYVFSG